MPAYMQLFNNILSPGDSAFRWTAYHGITDYSCSLTPSKCGIAPEERSYPTAKTGHMVRTLAHKHRDTKYFHTLAAGVCLPCSAISIPQDFVHFLLSSGCGINSLQNSGLIEELYGVGNQIRLLLLPIIGGTIPASLTPQSIGMLRESGNEMPNAHMQFVSVSTPSLPSYLAIYLA